MKDLINTPLMTRLSGFALLSISGNDRHSFLHGQFINDLNLIEQTGTQLSAWCNPKGQVISNFIIINTGSAYLLLFKADLKEYIQKRLGMFILRSDVQIKDISDQPLLGLANVDDLNTLGLNSDINTGEVKAIDGLVIVSVPDNSGRYLILGNPEKVNIKTTELSASLQSTENTTWDLLDILAGLAWITTKTQEQFLPQMLNLDALNGLNYQKGCYPGQEIIARLHYRGEVKKRIKLTKSGHKLEIGASIYADETGNTVGTVVNIAQHPDGHYYALTVLTLEKLENTLFSDLDREQTIDLLDLPYAIES